MPLPTRRAPLVNTGARLVLIDTGFADNGGPSNGRGVAALKAAGSSPDQIDVVLLSHFHADHLQGARLRDGKRFRWGDEVVTGITAVETSGHPPGHSAFAIISGQAKMMYLADITNNPVLFATHPEWKVVFDMDADKAIASRKRLLDLAASEGMRVAFYHASFPANGYIAREGTGFRFIPAQWS